jgi:hypothetical protein
MIKIKYITNKRGIKRKKIKEIQKFNRNNQKPNKNLYLKQLKYNNNQNIILEAKI